MRKKIAINHIDDFIYGKAPHPVACGHGVVVGNGSVVPEINFTLPPIDILDETWHEVRGHYTEMIQGVLQRAVELDAQQLLIEFETLPEMTNRPEWGLDITRLLADNIYRYHEKYGLKIALRLTPNDVREFQRPPLMRQGKYWDAMQELFAKAGAAGADLLAIESTGGKELCDDALLSCDLRRVIFTLGVLGSHDMAFLWSHIVDVCRKTGIIPSGDSACGFANTAMVLADRNMIPKIFAALVRVVSVPRSLVAVTAGAVGPSKDCAYEGPYLKAIAGIPISMEGKSAACAHFSAVGNVSQAVCDCWSNESVQNVQLLSGRAPVVSAEQLVYDCRLMNAAASSSPEHARLLRDWLSDSDSKLDVQAYVLRPDVVLRISEQIAVETEPYRQTVAAARAALKEIKQGIQSGQVSIAERENAWLDICEASLDETPESEHELIEIILKEEAEKKFIPEEYGI